MAIVIWRKRKLLANLKKTLINEVSVHDRQQCARFRKWQTRHPTLTSMHYLCYTVVSQQRNSRFVFFVQYTIDTEFYQFLVAKEQQCNYVLVKGILSFHIKKVHWVFSTLSTYIYIYAVSFAVLYLSIQHYTAGNGCRLRQYSHAVLPTPHYIYYYQKHIRLTTKRHKISYI